MASTIDSILVNMEEDKAFASLNAMAAGFLNYGDWESWESCKKGIIRKLRKRNSYDRILDSLEVWKLTDDLPSKHLAYLSYYEGFIATKKGNTILGIAFYKEALSHYQVLEDFHKCYSICRNLGHNISRLNDHPSARSYYHKALAYAEMLKYPEAKKRWLKLDIVNSYLYQREYDLALQFLNEKFSVDASEADILLTKVRIYIGKNEVARAEELFLKIENSRENNYEYLSTQAELLEAKNNLNAAINVREKIIESWGGGFKRDFYGEKVKLSTLYVGNKEYLKAASLLDTIINFFVPEFKPEQDDVNSLSMATPSIWLVEALQLKGDIFYEDSGIHNLRKANDYYLTAFNILLKLKNKFNSDISKNTYSLLSKKIAAKLMMINHELFSASKQEVLFDQAFHIAQNANAFVLRNAIEIRNFLSHATIDRELKNRFLKLEFMVSQTMDTIDTNILDEYDEVKRKIYEKFKILDDYLAETTVNLKEVQNSIQKQSVFVKYFFTDKECYIFFIGKKDYDFLKIKLPKKYSYWINSISETISKPADSDLEKKYIEASKQVYKLLVEPIANKNNQIEHFIIVPDAELRQISFAGLIWKPTKSWIEIDKFLISKYSFSYLYYSSQIRNSKRKRKGKNQIVGFGLSYDESYLKRASKILVNDFNIGEYTAEPDLKELDYAVTEVNEISSRFGGLVYENDSVNNKVLKKNLRENSIVHFTGHTWIDENDYLNSSLLIYPASINQDIYFSNSDILQLDLSNELIVLSTCKSSSGRLVIGEGIMSLGRSFTYSGSNAVVGNYWKTSDYSSFSIMEAFYENLQKGLSKDIALREAQLNYLEDDNLSNPLVRSPVHWAGWVLYGSYDPIASSSNSIILVVSILLLVLSSFFFIRRKRAK